MENETLKSTPLERRHIELGGKMVPFAGWNMPVQYREGIIAEHNHTRTKASVFDICHMGEFRIRGPGSAAALDALLARETGSLKPGSCRYNFMLNENGGVIDDLVTYRISEDEFFIVVNAGTKDGDAAHFRANLQNGVEFSDESDATAKIDLQGPESADVLERAGLKKESLPAYFKWMNTSVFSVPCLLSRTGYTGELGFELYIKAGDAAAVWDGLLKDASVKPAGLGCRDTLRTEMGYALYGHELDANTTPLEAGFASVVTLEGRKFIGSDALRRKPVAKKLTPIELEGRRAARSGAGVFTSDKEQKVGVVTSGVFSPSLGKAVALAYVDAAMPLEKGSELFLEAGTALVKGTVAELPFYKKGTVRKKL